MTSFDWVPDRCAIVGIGKPSNTRGLGLTARAANARPVAIALTDAFGIHPVRGAGVASVDELAVRA
jgi:hypothetical protein